MQLKPIDRQVDTPYRSDEELYFSWYLDELKEAEYIQGYDYEQASWILSEPMMSLQEKRLRTKTKLEERVLLSSHSYGCDFVIRWNKKAKGIFIDSVTGHRKNIPFLYHTTHKGISYIEIKPVYDKHNMTREFAINQKWVFNEYEVYVQLVKPIGSAKCLFAQTFTPERYLYTDKTLVKRNFHYSKDTTKNKKLIKTLNGYVQGQRS